MLQQQLTLDLTESLLVESVGRLRERQKEKERRKKIMRTYHRPLTTQHIIDHSAPNIMADNHKDRTTTGVTG